MNSIALPQLVTRLVFSKLKLILLFLWLFLFHFSSIANFKFRARESYQFHNLEYRGQQLHYNGLNNAINFWHEKPFDFSIGLAAGGFLSSSKTSEVPINGLDKKLNFYFLGMEAKYFFTKIIHGLFTRIGLYWDIIDTNSDLGKLNGWSYYSSLGWEFLITDSISLAPEIGIKQGDAQGLFFTTYSFSLGVHFY